MTDTPPPMSLMWLMLLKHAYNEVPELWGSDEAGDYLGIGHVRIGQLAREGRLPYVARLGPREWYVFRADDVRAFGQKRRPYAKKVKP